MAVVLCFDITQMTEADYAALYARAEEARRDRADRCRRREDAFRTIVSDALLRYAAATVLGLREITVARTPQGKPYLREREDFCFNLSHSGKWAVLAYGGSEVGIDVERITMDEKKEAVTRRHFTPREQDYIFQAEPDRQGVRFFEVWTAKESYLKFLGTGLTRPLSSFDVLTLPEPNRFGCLLGEDYYLTLHTREEGFSLEELSPEQLRSV